MSQTRVEHHNPPELPRSPAFTQAVSVTGPVKTVYVGGQDAVNAAGEIVGEGDLGAQTEQILRNLEAALAAAGARPEHVVKLNISVVPDQSLQAGFEAFARVWAAGWSRRSSRWRSWRGWATRPGLPRSTPWRSSRSSRAGPARGGGEPPQARPVGWARSRGGAATPGRARW